MVPSVKLLVLVEAQSASAVCVQPRLGQREWNMMRSGWTVGVVAGPRKPLCRTVRLSIAIAVVGLARSSSSLFVGTVRRFVARADFVPAVVVRCFSLFLETFSCV